MKAFRLLPVFAAFFGSLQAASACAVCMGDPNSQMAAASNSVLWTLLSLVGFIFVATAATAYFLYRQASIARSHEAEIQSIMENIENHAQ